MLFLERLVEFGIALDVLLVPLLVADAQQLHVEGAGVAHRSAFCAPAAGSWPVGELNQIERILNVGIELLQRTEFAGVKLAGHPAIQNRQWLGTDVFAQLEKLEKADAKGLKVVRSGSVQEFVVPAVDQSRPFFHGADGFFPLVTPRQL